MEYITKEQAKDALETLRGALSNAGVEAAKKLIDELPGKEMTGWVSTEEKLPTQKGLVVALCKDKVARVLARGYSGWIYIDDFGIQHFPLDFVTGWAALPN